MCEQKAKAPAFTLAFKPPEHFVEHFFSKFSAPALFSSALFEDFKLLGHAVYAIHPSTSGFSHRSYSITQTHGEATHPHESILSGFIVLFQSSEKRRL